MLNVKARYYRTIPLDHPGYEESEVQLDPTKTALVVLHCWDIGCDGGSPVDNNFFVGVGSLESFREAERILQNVIHPAMNAARKAGILVAHVEHEDIWAKHPSCQEELDPPAAPSSSYAPPPVVPGWREKIADRSHGKDYATKSPYANMDRAQIVAPLPDEPLVKTTNQFDRVLRKRGIENLIFTGFCADMCILRAPGGTEQMSGFGYRMYIMRDATFGVEFPDTIEEKISTRWGIRYFETHLGDTIASEDFLHACKKL